LNRERGLARLAREHRLPRLRSPSGRPDGSVLAIDASGETPARTRIVLADDHAIVRSALRALLEADGEFEIVAEAGDVDEAVR